MIVQPSHADQFGFQLAIYEWAKEMVIDIVCMHVREYYGFHDFIRAARFYYNDEIDATSGLTVWLGLGPDAFVQLVTDAANDVVAEQQRFGRTDSAVNIWAHEMQEGSWPTSAIPL